MTDDLIARLQNDCAEFEDPICGEAADALEAQARRIAELEDVIKFAEECVKQKKARIAELEARLKKYDPIEILGDQRKTVSVPARAALGEKE